MFLTLLRSLGMAPCPDAVSAEAAAFANTCRTGSLARAAAIIEPDLPEPEPDVHTDVGSEDINLALYSMEIRDGQGDQWRRADPVLGADTPEVPMPWSEPAVYCRPCQMWLNGQEQWDDHVGGHKHRKHMRRERQRAAAGEMVRDSPPEPPVYCEFCQFWLNGQEQWDDHVGGKKHRNNVRRDRRRAV